LEYLKLYLQSLKTTKSCKQDGESLFKILKHSIAAAVLWNDLPDDFRKISNFNQFKNILKSWNVNVQFVLTLKFV
jgi:hypothetical protein